jgi:hypothetical protein
MNITNSYISVLRYVSACGKKSVTEIVPQPVKNGINLKYAGPAEYKSVPIGMPQEAASITYKIWEQLVLNNGKTKNAALNGWFKIITPPKIKLSRVEQEIKNCYKKENFERIEFFKTLSPREKDYIIASGTKKSDGSELQFVDTNTMQFFATLSGYKPAWYCAHGYNRRVDFSKIKLNSKIADKYDVIRLPKGGLYFLNKNEVLKIIEENKDIYCAGQGLCQSESIENVYKKLLENLECGRIDQSSKGEALYGITLGYPRRSSLIFELENQLEGRRNDLRDNISLLKEKLLELLHSEKNPYKEYPKEVLEMLEKHIKEMTSTGSGSENIYQCVTYGNEEKAVNRMLELEKVFNENFKIEDLM